MSEEEKVQEKQEKKEETQEWNKDKQRADQEHANFLKAAAERDAAIEAKNATRSELEGIREQVRKDLDEKFSELTRQLKKEPELDPLTADIPDLAKSYTRQQTELETLREQLEKTNKALQEVNQERERRQYKETRDTTIDRIAKRLEKRGYPAKYRNKAVDKAEEIVKKDASKMPRDLLEAEELLESCWSEYLEKSKAEAADVPADSGGGSIAWNELEDKEEGAPREVASKVLEKIKRLRGAT